MKHGIWITRWRPYTVDVLVMLMILVLVWKLAFDIHKVRDIRLADETFYLLNGYRLLQVGFPKPSYGPIYSLWYFGLSCLQPDRLALYDVNWTMLCMLLSVSLYLLVRTLGGTRSIGLTAVFCLLISPIPHVWPFPAHFATIVLILGAVAALRVRSRRFSFALVGVTLLVATFIRPEFAVATLAYIFIGAALGLWAWFYKPHARAHLLIPALLLASCVVVFLGTFGNPLGGHRSIFAFSQHYAVNKSEAGLVNIHPWINYQLIFREDFGDAKTLGQAFRNNPSAFVWHMSRNARHPRSQVLLALLIAAGIMYWVCRRNGGSHLPRLHRGWFILGVCLIPTLLSIVLIHPREHYLIVGYLFTFAIVIANVHYFVKDRRVNEKLNGVPVLLCLALLFFVLVPSQAYNRDLFSLLRRRPVSRHRLYDRTMIAALKKVKVRRRVNILEGGYSRAFYAEIPFQYVNQWDKKSDESFSRFLQRKDVHIIVFDRDLQQDLRFKNDPEYQAFRSGQRTGDFVLRRVRGVGAKIAIRKDVLY